MGITKLHRICACCPAGSSTCDLGNTKADIVFLHGLGGNWHKTWVCDASADSPEFFWPKELANHYKSQYTVWSVQYPADITALAANASDFSVSKLVTEITSNLLTNKIGNKPYIFICHSLGGIVAKTLLFRAQEKRGYFNHNQLAGIAFFGTPHFGSDLATILEMTVDKVGALAWEKLAGAAVDVLSSFTSLPLGPIKTVFNKGRPTTTQLIAELGEVIDLAILNQNFGRYFGDRCRENPFILQSICENKATLCGIGPLIVKERSADPSIRVNLSSPPLAVDSIDEDHFGIVKPNNKEHPAWKKVIALVNVIEQEILPFSTLGWDDQDPNSNRYRLFAALRTKTSLRTAFVTKGLAKIDQNPLKQTQSIIKLLSDKRDTVSICNAIRNVTDVLQCAADSKSEQTPFTTDDVATCEELVAQLVSAWLIDVNETPSASMAFNVQKPNQEYKATNEANGITGELENTTNEAAFLEFARARVKRDGIKLTSSKLPSISGAAALVAKTPLKPKATVIPLSLISANKNPITGFRVPLERLVSANRDILEQSVIATNYQFNLIGLDNQASLDPITIRRIQTTLQRLDRLGRPLVLDFRESAEDSDPSYRESVAQQFQDSPLEHYLTAAFTDPNEYVDFQTEVSGEVLPALQDFFSTYDQVLSKHFARS
jgi:PGAP1-like protein